MAYFLGHPVDNTKRPTFQEYDLGNYRQKDEYCKDRSWFVNIFFEIHVWFSRILAV